MANYSDLSKLSKVKLPSGTSYAIIDKDARAWIAIPWAQSTHYVEKDFVVNKDDFYRCTAEHTSTTTFDSSKWQLTNVSTELKTIYAAIAGIPGLEYVLSTGALNTPDEAVYYPTDASSGVQGTLAPSSSTFQKIYLVRQIGGSYDEWMTFFIGGAFVWEKLGSTGDLEKALKNLEVIIPSLSGTGTSTGAVGTVSKTKIKATASGTALTTTSDTFIKSISPTSDTITEVTGTTKGKLATTTLKGVSGTVSIPNVSGNTTKTASKISAISKANLSTTTLKGVAGTTTASCITANTTVTASKATAGTAVTIPNISVTSTSVASGTLGTETLERGTDTVMYGCSVSNEELSFTYKPLSTTNVGSASANTAFQLTPHTFSDVTASSITKSDVTVATANASATTVATGGVTEAANGAIVTGVTASDVTASEITLGNAITAATANANATTVATGAVESATTDATIITGITTGDVSAITSLGTPTTGSAIKTVSVGTQPTVTISSGATGDVEVVTNVGTTTGTVSVTTTSGVHVDVTKKTS